MATAQSPRALFVTRSWPPAVGGMEVYSRALADALEGRTELTVHALPGRPDGRAPARWRIPGFFVRAIGNLLRDGRRQDVIVLGDLVLLPIVAVARLLAPRAKTVITVHGTDVFHDQLPGWQSRLYGWYIALWRRLGAQPTLVVANSGATGRHAERLGMNRVRVLPPGVHVPEAPDAGSPPQDYVLFVGRLIPRKGAAWFVQEVLPRLPDHLRLKIAGTRSDPAESAVIDSCPRTDFLGAVHGEELAQLRRRSVAVLVPNLDDSHRFFEGFGLVALEAAADGAVVLAADVDGIPDAVRDGETGFLLPPGDAEAWANAIRGLLAQPGAERATFIGRARAQVARHYNWDRLAGQILDACFPENGKQQEEGERKSTRLR